VGRQSILRTRVRFGETDAAGIVYYPTFFRWFDDGTHELLRAGDAPSRNEYGAPKFPLPIVECGATFIAPLQFDEPIEIVTTVAAIGESSLRIEHEVRTPDGKTCARGFEQRVYIAQHGGRLRKAPIPEELRARLEGPAAASNTGA
jgi:YbgC/YbaW family acyl-CoA thioester hydrolase